MPNPHANPGAHGPRAALAAVVLTVAAFCACPPSAAAQVPQLRFTELPARLPQRVVTVLHQDRAGFAWIGTQAGLVRYDGHTSLLYTAGDEPGRSLPGSVVQALAEDPEGLLWVGTISGLAILDPVGDSVRTVPVTDLDDPGSQDDQITALLPAGEGRMWVGTEGSGLRLVDAREGTLRSLHHDPEDPSTLPGNWISALERDASGRLWVGTRQGLALVDGDTSVRRITDMPDSRALVYSLHPAPEGGMWVGTRDHLVRLDSTGALRSHHAIPSLGVMDLAPAPGERLWVATYGAGLRLLDPATGTWVAEYRAGEGEEGPVSDLVAQLHVDRTGLLWVGYWGAGVATTNPGSAGFGHVGADDLGDEDVTDLAVMEDGGLLVTTFGGGLALMDGDGRIQRRISFSATGSTGSMGETSVLSAAPLPGGGYAVGTYIGGLLILDEDGSVIRRFKNVPGDSTSLPDDAVYALEPTGEGDLWVGTPQGLRRVDPREGVFRPPPAADSLGSLLGRAHVRTLTTDPGGHLWVGTFDAGAFVTDPPGRRVRALVSGADAEDARMRGEITAIWADEGRAWLGWRSRGSLAVLEHGGDPFATANTVEVLDTPPSAPGVTCIVSDAMGALWIGTLRGLFRYDPESGQRVRYGAADGLPHDEFASGACARAGSGRLAFGTSVGLVHFRSENMPAWSSPAPAVVSALRPSDPGAMVVGAPFQGGRVRLPYGKALGVLIGVLDYRAPDEQTFQYRFVGDDTWVEIGSVPEVTFAGLRPGEHVLEVRGRDAHGILSAPSPPFTIEVIPPFYMTWWFRLLLLSVALAGAAWTYRWRTGTIREHNALLRREINQRRRAEALEQKLHQAQRMEAIGRLTGGIAHDFNNVLTVVRANAGIAAEITEDEETREVLEEILRASGRATELVGDLMAFSRKQVLEPRRTDVGELVSGLLPILSRTLGETIHVDARVDPGLPECSLDPAKAESAVLNLAINARHAMPDGGHLHIHVRETAVGPADVSGVPPGSWVVLTVNDTGQGIPPENLDRIFEPFFTTKPDDKGTGLGLSMVYGFVRQSGGEIRVRSQMGEGTTFDLYFPVAEEAPQGRRAQDGARRP